MHCYFKDHGLANLLVGSASEVALAYLKNWYSTHICRTSDSIVEGWFPYCSIKGHVHYLTEAMWHARAPM